MIIRNGNEDEEEKLMSEMLNPLSPITPDIITFNILIKNIVRKIVSTKQNSTKVLELKNKITHLLSIIRELRLNYDLVTYNTLIDAFIEADDFNKAWNIYEEMLLNSKSSELLESEISFDNGLQSNILKPDAYTYTTLIKGLKSQSDSFSKILEIYKIIEEEELNDEYVTNSILDACVKYNQIGKAEEILNISEKKGIKLSVITYSILVKGYCNENKLKEAIELLNKMKLKSIKPNEIVYDCIMNCTIKNNNINAMQKVYNLMTSEGIFPNTQMLVNLIKGFSKAKYYDLIISLYDSIPVQQRASLDLMFFNCLLDSLIDSKNLEKINEICDYLEAHETLKPNIVTLSTFLKAYCKLGQEVKAEELYNKIKLQIEIQLDEVFFNTYADYFARQKNIPKTLEIFEDMKNLKVIRSTIIYSIIIRMYGMCNMEIKSIEF
jgi:pentatricopeptide repeat domain-containing protein 1